MLSVVDADDAIFASQAAQIIGISAETARAWHRSGRLSAIVTANGVRLFSRTECEALRRVRDAAREEPMPTPAA